jgi:hypothetical protein
MAGISCPLVSSRFAWCMRALGGLPDALIGPPETAVWQQETGFSEW